MRGRMLGDMSPPSSRTRRRGRRLLAGAAIAAVIGVTWIGLEARSRTARRDAMEAPGSPRSALDERRDPLLARFREHLAGIAPAVHVHSTPDPAGDRASRFWMGRHQLERVDDDPGTSIWFLVLDPGSLEELSLTLAGDSRPGIEEGLLLDGHPLPVSVQEGTIRATLGRHSLKRGLNHVWFSSVRKITVRIEAVRSPVAAATTEGGLDGDPILPASWIELAGAADAEERSRELLRQHPDHPLASLPLLVALTRKVRSPPVSPAAGAAPETAGSSGETADAATANALESLDILQDLLEDSTGASVPWSALGSILEPGGEPGMAWACRLQACVVSPGDPDPWMELLDACSGSPEGPAGHPAVLDPILPEVIDLTLTLPAMRDPRHALDRERIEGYRTSWNARSRAGGSP